MRPDDAAALRTENGRLREANERLRLLLEDKDAKIADLEERVARVERLISRNSGNSSMPPSTDDLPGKKPPEREGRGGAAAASRASSRGAPGAYLAWTRAPGRHAGRVPGGQLRVRRRPGRRALTWACGTPTRSPTCPRRRRRPSSTTGTRWSARCGRRHVADAPPEAAGAPGTVTYGLNFQAWCVFLMVMHHVPVERCADIIESMSGTRPVRRVGARAARPRRQGGRRGEQDDPGADHPRPRHLRGRDPAPRRVRARSPRRRSTCRSRAPACSPVTSSASRDLPSFKDFVYSDLHGTVVVHDRYVNYDAFAGISHQLCTPAPAPGPGGRRPGLPRRDLARPGRRAPARPHPRRQRGPRPGPGRGARRRTAEHLTLFRSGVTVGLSQIRRVPGAKSQAAARPAPAGMPAPPRSRRAAVPDRHRHPADPQPGRTRPAAIQDPAVLMGCAPPSRREKWWCAARDVVILVVLTRPSSSLTLGAVFKGPFIALRARGSDSSEPRLPGRRLQAGSRLGGRGWTR